MSKVLTDTSRLVVKLPSGAILPLVLTVDQYRKVVGDHRDGHTVRADVAKGLIPSLPRPVGTVAWKIPTAPALERLGIGYDIVAA